ncbi:S-layer homology domain-containing protein [Microbacteriaceae bacterium VKM Ac-2855]|nr:S-layer homology domain-containing protein [Microbacteriaceae bacterium VKM Ac-2855]
MSALISRMRRLGVVALIAALAAVTMAPAASAAATTTVTGVVYGTTTGSPLAEVHVYLEKVGEPFDGTVPQAQTDASGRFTITNADAGQRVIRYDPVDRLHLPRFSGGSRTNEDADTVTVRAGATTTAPTIVLPLGGTISGVVTADDPDFDPTVIAVDAIDLCQECGGRGFGTPDADGRYTMTGLEAGSYSVSFTNYIGLYTPGPYPTQYWRGASDFEKATPVVVGLSENVTGIDAALERGPSLSGRVTSAATGDPLPGVLVDAFRVGGELDEEGRTQHNLYLETDDNGEYMVAGIEPGIWVLHFDPSGEETQGLAPTWLGGVSTVAESRHVTAIDGEDVGGLDVRLEQGAVVTGLVSGGPDLDPAAAFVNVIRPCEQVGTETACDGGSASTDSDGRYTVDSLPSGTYTVEAYPDDDSFAKAVWIGETRTEDGTDLVLASGDSAAANLVLADADPAARFADVPVGAPFFAEIQWLAKAKISTGYVDGAVTSYRPNEEVTRQAMAAFLYRLHLHRGGESFSAPATASFSDVPTSHPFFREIEWMKSAGITTGNADGTFAPNSPVSRQAMSAFLARMSGETVPAVTAAPFSDVRATDDFADAIAWMAAENISRGYDDGTFRPLEPVSRQAMAAFLFRYDATR